MLKVRCLLEADHLIFLPLILGAVAVAVMNRETNTIGSKCQDLDITRTVVDMKAEIEKIREQIQNLE